jgi:pepF/M3 family oligoendopeptidase
MGYPLRTNPKLREVRAMATGTSKLTWDLESIFPGGSASKEFEKFRKDVAAGIKKTEKKLEKLPREINDDTFDDWVDIFMSLQTLKEQRGHAESFAYCLAAQDVKDEGAMVILDDMLALYAETEAIKSGVEEVALAVDDETWNRLIGHPKLAGAAFFWNELRHKAQLRMEPRMEKLATDLSVSGYHAWNLLYTRMAGDLKAEFEDEGKTETLSMGQLSNKFSSPNRDTRRSAFEKLESTWKTIEPLVAMELNSQAGFRLSLYKARGWDSPLFEPLLMGRVKKETIDAMWNSIAAAQGRISDYIGAKKKLLGIKDFRWYDQTAPIGGVEKTFTYEEACDFVIKHLANFSKDLGDFARMAIDKRWIEAEDRPGKMAGGFCTGLPIAKQSRIFMTFSGNYNEMMTLAHEIGHAYHSWVLSDRDYFARSYSMLLAETASTFNEMLVTDAALEEAKDDAECLSLVEKKALEHFTMFCNIRARYLFDCQFYEERKKGTVPKERLNATMVDAQKQAFGDILADDGYHSLFWASKLHFSETGVPFYNYPYTFGHLFAGGIYARAKQEGEVFADKYRGLLIDTGSMTCEEVAEKHLGVDLTTGEFWNSAVARALEDVDKFIELAS